MRAQIGKRLRWLLIALAFLPLFPLLAQDPDIALEGKNVVAVRVVNELGEVLEGNPPGIAQQPNGKYDSEAVRESLRQLFRTGRYADVRAVAADATGGVRLDFVVRQNFFVDEVHFQGLEPPPGVAVARSSLRLGLGQPFRESEMKQALERLKRAMANEGFFQATAEYSVTPDPATHQVDILIRVTPGRRAKIGALEVRNQTSFSDAALLRRSKIKPGRDARDERIDGSGERVRKFLVKKGHLGARAIFRRGEFDPQSNTVPLTLEASAGPSVRVEVTGASISQRELRKILPIYQEGTVDEDLLQEGRRDIRDVLEREGYFDSQVSYRVELDAEKGQQVITYDVVRGPRRRLIGVAFEGNSYFGGELLREQVRITPAAFLSRGRFSRRLLQDDEEAIVALYAASGFTEAKVKGEVIEDYAKQEGNLFVVFHIEEGPQTLIASLTLEGNEMLTEDYLRGQIGASPCQAYSDFNVASDRDNLLALYYNDGMPEARFTAFTEERKDAAEALKDCPQIRQPGKTFRAVDVTYTITEGSQITVKSVLLSGYAKTRPHVIEREVQIQPGEPLRQGDVIETQRRLYNLGIFNRVAIAPLNPTGTETEKTVVVQVEEASRYTMAYGGGIEIQRLGSGGDDPVSGDFRASPSGLFEISRTNLFGRAHTGAFKVRASTLQSRALLSYGVPSYFGRREFSLLLTGLADRTTDVRTFTSTRYEGSGQIVYAPNPFSSFLFRYSYRRVLVDADSLRVSPDQIPLFSQPTKISSFGLSWLRDRRDNPTDATKGNFNAIDVSLAHRGIASSATFVRLFAQNSSYHPLTRSLVFARSTRIGIEEPFANTTPFDIPLPERFFAGGGSSLRGIGLNQAGPRDPNTGFPVGGLAMVLFNQELRFPMKLPFLRVPLGGAVFYDAGNVFSRANRITLRSTPLSPTDLNYFSHSIGFGVRYGTPVGPVRVDLGYQLNPPRFEFCKASDTPTVPRCPMGQAVTTSRLPRFQFFFTIGPVF